jgi:two-component system, OmpR family, response regulator
MTKGRVLIVEDEPDLAWVEQFNLENEGYEVRWAAEGMAAIDALEDFRPHVIVLDLMLPHVDGWAVLGKAQAIPANDRPSVIVVSAVAGMEDRMKAEYLGVGHFLAKPFEIDDLLRLVSEAVEAA